MQVHRGYKMSTLRSPTGSGLGVGRSDSQPNLTSDSLVAELSGTSRMTLRSKRKQTDENEIMAEEFSEMRKQMTQIMAMLTAFMTNQKDSMDSLSKSMASIKEDITDIKTVTDKLTSEQMLMKQDIIKLTSQNEATEKRLEMLDSEVKFFQINPSSSSSPVKYEDIMAEISDREQRSKNIILVGLPEPASKEPAEMSKSDKNEIFKIMKLIDPDCPEPVKLFRLGRPSLDKNRPMKVCFKTNETAKYILRNKVNLGSDTIKIYSDQTPKQQEHLKLVQQDLKRRVENGEENLTIKYKKGVPIITVYHPKTYE